MPADDFTTSLSTTSHSPRAYCPCQTDLSVPTATECPLLIHSLSQHRLPPYIVPTASHNLSQRRVYPKSITAQQPQLHNLHSCCLQHTKPILSDMSSFNATSHPTVLPVASYCLSAQTFTAPQALLIPHNPSRELPASCLPSPVLQLPPKRCLSPILPTIKFPPCVSTKTAPCHPQHLTHLPTMRRPSMCMSGHHRGVQIHVPSEVE